MANMASFSSSYAEVGTPRRKTMSLGEGEVREPGGVVWWLSLVVAAV